MTILGSLVLSANNTPTTLSCFTDPKVFYHTEGRIRGRCTTEGSPSHEVHVPSRGKHFLLNYTGPDVAGLGAAVAGIESSFQDGRYLHKLWLMMQQICFDNEQWVAVVNNTGIHGDVSLLSWNIPIYLTAVGEESSNYCELVWSTEPDLAEQLRSAYAFKFVYYRFPVLLNRPMFIHSQPLCSHWWTMTTKKGFSTLKALNAVEVRLFRDPSVAWF